MAVSVSQSAALPAASVAAPRVGRRITCVSESPPALPLHDELLHRAFSQLPPMEREALLLIAWEGFTPTQAARVLECSPVAMRVRLHRGRRRLARLLECKAPRPLIRPREEAS
jgi:DNA-directed RNA polymerase specialized sigma24 family protein